MARPRKANELKTGDYTQDKQKQMELIDRELELTKTNKPLKCPNWVKDKIAKAEFKRLSKELADANLLSYLDLNILVNYCISYANYRKATEELMDAPLTVTKVSANGVIGTDINPLVKVQKIYSDEIKKYASMLGLTVDSRMKIATIKVENSEEDPLLKALKGDDDE